MDRFNRSATASEMFRRPARHAIKLAVPESLRAQLTKGYRRWASDIAFISYPKCGRTWLRMMIGGVLQKHYNLEDDLDMRINLWRLARGRKGMPKIWVSHEGDPHVKSYDTVDVPWGFYRRKKVLFLVRDPRDVVVSWYFHRSKRLGLTSEPLEQFVRNSTGGVESIVQYYAMWMQAFESGWCRGLIISYEGLHREPEKYLKQIVEFIGLRNVNSAHIRESINESSFDRMRRLELSGSAPTKSLTSDAYADRESLKTRHGRPGGFRQHLSVSDLIFAEAAMLAGLPLSWADAWIEK